MTRTVMELSSRLSELSEELSLRGSERKDVQLSIVVPAYNEKNRLPGTILNTIRWCHIHLENYEILIVDDGSSDETLELARLFSEFDGNIRTLVCPHLGKGAAVRTGMLNAIGEKILFMDADGATPLDEIPKLTQKIDDGFPVAIGSRVVLETKDTKVITPFHRKMIGRVFSAIVNFFAVGGIRDTQCGFKMFRKDACGEIFKRQKLTGFAFDVEILYLADRMSLPVAEVPVNWVNQKESKVNILTDSLKMLKDVVLIRMIHTQ